MNALEKTDIDNLLDLSGWQPTGDNNATDAPDRTERRRLQNRQAQRNHRKKQKAYVSSLEQQVIENLIRGKQDTCLPTPQPTSPLFMPFEIPSEPSSSPPPLSLPVDIPMVPTPENEQSHILSTPLSFSPDIAPYSHGLWHDGAQSSSIPFAPSPGKHSPHDMDCGCVTSPTPFHHNSTYDTLWMDMCICGNEGPPESSRSYSCSLHLDRLDRRVPGIRHHHNSDQSVYPRVIRCPCPHPAPACACPLSSKAEEMPLYRPACMSISHTKPGILRSTAVVQQNDEPYHRCAVIPVSEFHLCSNRTIHYPRGIAPNLERRGYYQM